MNILFTMTGSWGTGSGTVVEAVSHELVQRGHRVRVLYPEAQVGRREAAKQALHAQHDLWRFPIQREGVELYTFPLMIADPNPTNYRDAPTFKELTQEQLDLYITAFQEAFSRTVEAFRPDVVECQHVWAMPYAIAELGHPYIAVAHHSDQMGFHYDERMRPYARRAAQAARYVFAISRAVREEVMELYSLSPERVPLIFNGYDQQIFQPRPEDRAALLAEFDLDIPADAPIVTFAGKLSKTKGVDILLLANRLIQRRREVHFCLFGTGALEDVLDEALEDEYLLDNVHLLGHRPYETIARFHNVARLSVMPSRTEGFGIAGLEAMGCGLPLVITRAGGVDEYAVGAVIDPEDVDALAEAVLRLVEMPEAERERLGAQALEAARAFSWPSITDQRLEYYRKMVDR